MILLEGHQERVRGLAFSPDGRTLASAGGDQTVRLWDLATAAERAVLRGHRLSVLGVVYNPDGRLLVSADDTPSARVWDPTTGELCMVIEPMDRERASLLRVFLEAGSSREAADAARYCVLRVEPDVRRWIEASERTIGRGPAQQALEFEAKRSGRDVTYVIPSTPAGTRAGTFVPGSSFVRDDPTGITSALSPDGGSLALTEDRDILLWGPGARRPQALTGHRDLVRTLAFSPDGLTLASGGQDGTVRFWDVASGRERACFEWQVGMICSVAFSIDGMTAAAGGWKGVVVWDVDEIP